jgi:DNA-binding CsgD family transcriptional regulator
MALSPTAADRLAGIFSGFKELGLVERDLHHQVLRETLRANPKYLGVWAVWEPDALDGRDAEHAGTPAHDATGRFLPVWHRRLGDVRVEPNIACDQPGLGAYYLLPTRAKKSVVVGPYEYPMGGTSTMIVTLAAPIMVDGTVLGAAGVDFSLEALAAQVVAGPTSQTVALVTAVETDLRRHLVFLDPDGLIAFATSTAAACLAAFADAPIRKGRRLPTALQPLLRSASSPSPSRPPRRPELTLTTRGHGLRVQFIQAGAHHRPGLLLLEELPLTPPTASLTPREREVMQWLAEGKSNEEISLILAISAHTVKNHLDKIFKKLGVDSRHAASVMWRREAGGK